MAGEGAPELSRSKPEPQQYPKRIPEGADLYRLRSLISSAGDICADDERIWIDRKEVIRACNQAPDEKESIARAAADILARFDGDRR